MKGLSFAIILTLLFGGLFASAHRLLAASETELTFTVLNSSDDARTQVGSSRGDTAAALHFMGAKNDMSFVHGLRFANVNLPAGTKVKSATLYLYSAGDVGALVPTIKFKGELGSDVSTFKVGSGGPADRTVSVATVEYRPDLEQWSQQGFMERGIDVTPIFNEVVNQPLWQSGNAVAFIDTASAVDGAYISYSTFDRDSSRAPKLVVELEQAPSLGIVSLYKRLQQLVELYKLERGVTLSNMTADAEIMAWIYPGKPGCSAMAELADGRKISVLKPEYYSVTENGDLNLLTQEDVGCNGFSKANLSLVKSYANKVFVTVSAGDLGTERLMSKQWDDKKQTIDELVGFTVENDIDGVEIDFEGYGAWSEQTYRDYLGYINELAMALHAVDKEIMIDVPAISGPIEQNYYELRYQDIADLSVDYVVVMAYDYQYDYGAGKSIAPNQWVQDVVKNALQHIGSDRLVIGLPSYGYYGHRNSYNITVTSSETVVHELGNVTAIRDPYSYEMVGSRDGISYVYQDAISLDKKRRLLESLGVRHISVWSLGGNAWFSAE